MYIYRLNVQTCTLVLLHFGCNADKFNHYHLSTCTVHVHMYCCVCTLHVIVYHLNGYLYVHTHFAIIINIILFLLLCFNVDNVCLMCYVIKYCLHALLLPMLTLSYLLILATTMIISLSPWLPLSLSLFVYVFDHVLIHQYNMVTVYLLYTSTCTMWLFMLCVCVCVWWLYFLNCWA